MLHHFNRFTRAAAWARRKALGAVALGAVVVAVAAAAGFLNVQEPAAAAGGPPAPNVVETTLNVVEGASVDFHVRLTAAPDADVSVGLSSGDSRVSVHPASLTFTSSNWSTSQVAAATSNDNADDEGDTYSVTVSATLGENSDTVAITVYDDDTVGVLYTATTPAIVDNELSLDEGADGSITYVLTANPTADVTVTPSSGTSDLTVKPTSCVIDHDASPLPSCVFSLHAAEDATDTADREATLSVSASGGNYDDVSGIPLDVNIVNTTIGPVIVAPETEVPEGSAVKFKVTLTGPPAEPVKVSMTGWPSGISLTPDSLSLNSDNWDGADNVVTAQLPEDDVNQGDTSAVIYATVGEVISGVVLTVQDNDSRGLAADYAGDLEIKRPGAGVTVEYYLTSQPYLADVTLTVTAADAGVLSVVGSPCVIPSSNWKKRCSVTVTNSLVEGDEPQTVMLRAVANGGDYVNVVKNLNVSLRVTGLTAELDDYQAVDLALTGSPKNWWFRIGDDGCTAGSGDGVSGIAGYGAGDYTVRVYDDDQCLEQLAEAGFSVPESELTALVVSGSEVNLELADGPRYWWFRIDEGSCTAVDGDGYDGISGYAAGTHDVNAYARVGANDCGRNLASAQFVIP